MSGKFGHSRYELLVKSISLQDLIEAYLADFIII